MKLNSITQIMLVSFCTVFACYGYANVENELTTIVVSADTPEETNPNFASYTKSGAVSSRATNTNAMQNLDSVVRSISGAYTQIDPGQGAISVNIRNMTGLGRVNMMIDNVPQTQLGTSANGKGKFHDGNGPMSQFGGLIDQNFLTRVDITKGYSEGAAGINALMGNANFKTIDAEDVLLKERSTGVLMKLNYGSNGLGKNGMLAMAAQKHLFDSGNISGLFALSQHKLTQNYTRGDGSSSQNSGYLQGLEQKPKSYLAKLAFKPHAETELKFSTRNYTNNIAGRQIESYTHTFEGRYNPNKWVNMHLLAANTKTLQEYNDNAALWTIEDATTINRSHYIDLNNISQFKLDQLTSTLTIGVNLFHNKYTRTMPANNRGNNEGARANAAFAPEGKQNIRSLYWNSLLELGMFNFRTGLKYSSYNLKGYKPQCDIDDAIYCLPSWGLNIERKYHSLDPAVNLSVKLADWFEPFVEYNKTSRAPNVQEIFNTSRNGLSVNPYLRPEKANTWQTGFNISKENIIANNDILGLKVIYFNSNIKNYIFKESFYGCGNHLCNNVNNSTEDLHAQLYVNDPNKVKTKGWEVELNYNSNYFFTNLSYTRTQSTAPTSVGAIILGGFGTESYTEQPKDHANIEVGTHLLDKKLTLSTILKYTGKAKRVHIEGTDNDGNIMVENLPKIPVIVDFYANYKINPNFILKAGVQNVTNKNYMDALNSYNSSTNEEYDDDTGLYKFSNTARGRTYTVGAEIRF